MTPFVFFFFFKKGQECAPKSSSRKKTHISVEGLWGDVIFCLLEFQMLILGHSVTKRVLVL